ncbi:MAG: AhpC/TSA family protein [Phycisphaerales bacterium]|nr:MAG: AhpC/TSA family protein [Phycisphaerales bacterium]
MTTVTDDQRNRSDAAQDLSEFMREAKAQTGESLLSLTESQPRMVVFLRHTGCPFCHETAAEVAARRERIEARGVGIVFVHQSTESEARTFFEKYGLEDLPRISDPERNLYRAFNLKRGNIWQIGGPKVWWRSMAALFKGHRVGRVAGDPFQMPGVFIVDHGRIVSAFRHGTQADRPDYEDLASCPIN